MSSLTFDCSADQPRRGALQERRRRRWPGQLSRILANATKSAASEIRRRDKAKYVLQFGHAEVTTKSTCTCPRLVLFALRCVTGELDGKPSGSAVIFGRSPGPPNSSATSIWLRCDMQNHSRFKNRPACGPNPSGSGLELIGLAVFVLPKAPISRVRFFNVRRYP
jgi:hypothetical protein